MIRKIYNEFWSANTIGVTVEHNGYHGGDGGHGGYVKIGIEDLASTSMECEEIVEHDNRGKQIWLKFEGSTERQTLLAALKMIVKELEENPYLPNDNVLKEIDFSEIKREHYDADPELEDNY